MELASSKMINDKTGYSNTGNSCPSKQEITDMYLNITGTYHNNELVGIDDIHVPEYYLTTVVYGDFSHYVNNGSSVPGATFLKTARREQKTQQIIGTQWRSPDAGILIICASITEYALDYDIINSGDNPAFNIWKDSSTGYLFVLLTKKIRSPEGTTVTILTKDPNILISINIQAWL